MPTRNISLTDQQDILVDELVNRGEYQSASEVFRESLRLLEERRAIHAAKLAALREAVQVGWDDLDAGRYTQVAPDQIRAHVAALRRASVAA